MLKRLAAIALLLTAATSSLAAQLSGQQRGQIEDAIRDRLKDSESARFKWSAAITDIYAVSGYGTVCLPFNSMNGFGGYSGFAMAWLEFKYLPDDRIANLRIIRMGDESTKNSCSNIAEKVERYKSRNPRITEDQARAGCGYLNSKLFCGSPGTGMCWEKGHDPWKGESPARAVDVGNEGSPTFGRDDLCSK